MKIYNPTYKTLTLKYLMACLICVGILVDRLCTQQWEWQNPLPQGNTLNDVYVFDENKVIAVGNAGTILKTNNGGELWDLLNSGVSNPLTSVHFTDSQYGWAVGESGTILHTNDGGISWNKQESGTSRALSDVYFIDSLIGWAIGGGFIINTTNGGETWEHQEIGTNIKLSGIHFIDSKTGWVVGDWGTIIYTNNGGESWTSLSGTSSSLYDVHFIDSQTGWVAGRYGTILHTTDGGKSWERQKSGISNEIYAIQFTDMQNGWAVGWAGNIVNTVDGGKNWQKQSSGTSNLLHGIHFSDSQNGWVVGKWGTIAHTKDGGKNWVEHRIGISNSLLDVHFSDSQTGWAVGVSGIIIHTNDGGKNWTEQSSELSKNWLYSVNFINLQAGWIAGSYGTILHTNDGGKSWNKQESGTYKELFDVYFIDAQTGWAVGGGFTTIGSRGIILHTHDGGENWKTKINDIDDRIRAIHFTDSQYGWAVGESGTILHTNDGGDNWTIQRKGPWRGFTDVYFIDSQTGWVVGTLGTIIYTNNGGESWKEPSIGTLNSLSSVHFIDPQTGWAVGGSVYYLGIGTILCTTDGGETWTEQTSDIDNKLSGVYFIDPINGWAVGEYGTILKYTSDMGIGNFGSVQGEISNYLSLPVHNARVQIDEISSLYSLTDENGIYIINAIPANRNYTVSASAFGYHKNNYVNVSVTASTTTENIDIILTPIGDVDPVITTLEVDPNPRISTVMEGGTAYRYYKVIDRNTDSPISNALILVTEGYASYPFRSNQDGIVAIKIDSEMIGGVGSDKEFTIFRIENKDLSDHEIVRFRCKVVDREVSKYWELEGFARADIGVGLVKYLSVGLGYWNTSTTSILYRGLNETPSYLLFNRQTIGEMGTGVGVATPAYIKINNFSAGGGIQVGVNGFYIEEDLFKFDYIFPGSPGNATSRFLLFARGNVGLLSPLLNRLLLFLEKTFTDYEYFTNAYQYDFAGLGARGSGNLFLGTVAPLGGNLLSYISAGLGGEVETYTGYEYDHARKEYGVRERSSTEYSGKILLDTNPLRPPANPLGKNYSSDIIKTFMNPLNIDRAQLYFYSGRSHEIGLRADQKLNPKYFTMRNDVKVSSKYKISDYPQNYAGKIISYNYLVDYNNKTKDVFSNAGNYSKSILAALKSPAEYTLGNTTHKMFYENVFNEIGYLQEVGSDIRVEYSKDSTFVEKSSGFELKLGLNFLLKGSFGAGFKFNSNLSALTERGYWISGEHYPIEKYYDIPSNTLTYKDIVQEMLYAIPKSVWNSFVSLVQYINPLRSGTQQLIGSGTLSLNNNEETLYIGENGTHITFPDGSIPPEIDTLTVASWGWWGSSPGDTPSDLTKHQYEITAAIKQLSEEIYGLRYGIGGFYQFEPMGTGLLSPATLTIVYSDEEIDGFDETELAVYWEDSEKKRWVYLGGDVDTENNTVTVEIDTLRVFTLAPRLPGTDFELSPQKTEIDADGLSSVDITSSVIYNNDGTVIADGSMFTVTTDLGNIDTPDLNPEREGTQIESFDGRITFTLRSSEIAGTASILAESVYGISRGTTTVAFTDTIPPPAPVITNVITDYKSISLEWDEITEPDLGGYLVYFNEGASGPPYEGISSVEDVTSPVDVGSSTNYKIRGLQNDIEYLIAVRAYDISNNLSDYSNEVTAVPQSTQPPGAIPIENVIMVADTGLYVSWIAQGSSGLVGRASFYEIRYSTEKPNPDTLTWWENATEVEYTKKPSDAGTRESFTIWGVSNNGSYYVGIRAGDETNNLSAITISGMVRTLEFRTVEGWNLVSLPVQRYDSYYRDIFPTATQGTLYRFDGAYFSSDTLDVGQGYWLRMPLGQRVKSSGQLIEHISIDLNKGWNLIGGPSYSLTLNALSDPSNVVVPGTLYGFDGTYQLSDVLVPGKGYWIRASDNGTIIYGVSGESGGAELLAKSMQSFGEDDSYTGIKIVNADGLNRTLYFGGSQSELMDMKQYSLPPLPPGNAFDVRFQDGYYVSSKNEENIIIQGDAYPIKLTIESAYSHSNYRYTLTEIVDGQEKRTHNIQTGERVEITDKNVKLLKVSIDGKDTQNRPETFSLSQNFPNPFNPTTTIRYELPKDVKVTLEVFNILGQRVAVLVNEEQPAGYYEVVFNASNLASGMYIYRIKAGEFVEVKRSVFMK